MSKMSDFSRNAGNFLPGAARGAAGGQVESAFGEGFETAANLCLQLLTTSIDGLMGKINSGTMLTSDEQVVLAKLTALKVEMVQALHAWEPSDG